jgi:hypothetical protein
MLPHFYKFAVLNACGQTILANGVTVKMRRWKRSSDGSVAFESAEATVLENTGTLATSFYLDGTAQDNSADKWEGATVEFAVTAPASASGPVALYVKRSTDGGTDYDDDASALEMERMQFTTSGTKRLTFQI